MTEPVTLGGRQLRLQVGQGASRLIAYRQCRVIKQGRQVLQALRIVGIGHGAHHAAAHQWILIGKPEGKRIQRRPSTPLRTSAAEAGRSPGVSRR